MVLFFHYYFSVDFIFNNIFEQRHRDRFNVVIGVEQDIHWVYTNQSRIALASGGLFGEGFLEVLNQRKICS